jgi:hypothetical protein
MAIQTHWGEMEDHTKETTKITTEGPEFEMSSVDGSKPCSSSPQAYG